MKTSCIKANIRKWLKNKIKLTKQKIHLIMRHGGQDNGKTGIDRRFSHQNKCFNEWQIKFSQKESHVSTLIQDEWTTAG